jgi:purine catabolism regulator
MVMQSSVSIKDLLRLALPAGSRLVTGNPEARVNWVRRTRVQAPAFLNLEPGELALLSIQMLRLVDERLTLARVVGGLAQVGVGAIGVQGALDREGIDRARALDVALLALPEGTRLLEVERAVTRLLLDREAQVERRAQENAEQLAKLSAENRGLEAILQAVTRTTGKVTIVHDVAGQPVAHTALKAAPALAVEEVGAALGRNGVGAVGALGYTVPLVVEGRRAGYLTIINGGVFDELDRVTAERGAMVCAMELAKQKAVVEAETRVRGDWVQQWLTGGPQDDERLEASAAQAGVDLERPYMVALFRCGGNGGAHMVALLRAEVRSRRIAGVVGQAPDGALVLYPVSAVQRAIQVTEAIRVTLGACLSEGVACGLGQPAQGLSALRKSYRQAERALRMGVQLRHDGCAVYFGDLSLYRLLLSVEDRQELQRFFDESLGPIVEYDARHDGELVQTLEAFFANNGNLARTSESLCVHRNTLSYRLGRVAEITGLDLDNAETRLMLHLALKVGRVLEATGQA